MQRALDSAIGLPRRSTSALSMVVLVMPAEVRRNLNRCSFARGYVALPSDRLTRGAQIIVPRSHRGTFPERRRRRGHGFDVERRLALRPRRSNVRTTRLVSPPVALAI